MTQVHFVNLIKSETFFAESAEIQGCPDIHQGSIPRQVHGV